jgi:DNA polymerase-3 subunit epsilon
LDAEILADVYLAMTGGQVSLSLGANDAPQTGAARQGAHRLRANRHPLLVVRAGAEELAAHGARLAAIDESSGGKCLWLHPGEDGV